MKSTQLPSTLGGLAVLFLIVASASVAHTCVLPGMIEITASDAPDCLDYLIEESDAFGPLMVTNRCEEPLTLSCLDNAGDAVTFELAASQTGEFARQSCESKTPDGQLEIHDVHWTLGDNSGTTTLRNYFPERYDCGDEPFDDDTCSVSTLSGGGVGGGLGLALLALGVVWVGRRRVRRV